MRAHRLAALVAIAALAVWGALVLLRTERSPAEARAPIPAPVSVEHSTAELPKPGPPRPTIEPLVPTVAEIRTKGGLDLRPAAGLFPGDPGASALEVVILQPDGRAADSSLWTVTIHAETPPFQGGSNLRRILMLDAARGSYLVRDLLPDLLTSIEVSDDEGYSLLSALVPGLPVGQARRIELRLPKFPVELELFVSDEAGSPLAGATVAFGRKNPMDSPRWVQADDRGRVSRTVSGRDDGIALQVRCTGYASRTMGNVSLQGRSTTLRVILEPERVVRVFVCDVYGAPIEVDSVGARIGIHSVVGIRLEETAAGPGWWELHELPEGTVTLIAGFFGDTFTLIHDTEEPEARFELADLGTLIVHWDPPPGQQDAVSGIYLQRSDERGSRGRILDRPASLPGTRTIVLPQGSYQIGLSDFGLGPIAHPNFAEIRAGQSTEVSLSP